MPRGATLTTAEKGYGGNHPRLRQLYAPSVAAGRARCAEPICLMPTRWIQPGTPWDLAHGPTRDTYRGPAHARCNRSEGATRGNLTRGTTPGMTLLTRIRSRQW